MSAVDDALAVMDAAKAEITRLRAVNAALEAQRVRDEEHYQAAMGMRRKLWVEAEQRNAALVEALRTARIAIKALHGREQWDIYERCSPEMKQIDAALAKAKE